MAMDLSRATGSRVIRMVNGEQYSFRKLSVREIADLSVRWRAADRAALSALCDECGLTARDKFDRLREFDDRGLMVSDAIRRIFTLDGSADVVEAASGRKVEELPFTSDELVALAAEIVGVKLDLGGADDDGGDDEKKAEANPPQGTG